MDNILINGQTVPSVSFGTWKLEKDKVPEVIYASLDAGYRFFDLAQAYQNDRDIVETLKSSGIAREKLVISEKLWTADRGYDDTLRACEGLLKRLELEYLDIYLVHWPAAAHMHENWRELNADTWRGMERLYEEGLVRAIGVCNCRQHHLESFMQDANVPVMINQIEFHPGQINKDTVSYCKSHNILVEAWGTLGHGKMLKRAPLKTMAEKYGKNAAQLCVRYCLQKGLLPVVKSADKLHMKQNLEVFDFEIEADDIERLDQMPYMGGSGLDPDRITIFG